MNSIRVLVVDDERIARDGLQRLLSADPEIELVGEAADGKAAIDAIQRLKPDVVFLDVQIPEIDGFGVVSAIGIDNMPVLIFVTAYDQYTLKAFEVHALDYLLKPFDAIRLEAALKRAKQQVISTREQQKQALRGLLDSSLTVQQPLKRLSIKSGGKIIFLELEQIDYIEGAGNYLCVHAGSQEFLTRETMSVCEAKLHSSDFVRIHRSTIVNRSRVRELKPWFTGEYVVILNNGKELTLSRGYRDRLPLLLAEQ
jgi:two-component system, LytTR family, response regulator